MVAVRVVAAPVKEHMRGPRATASADLGVLAALAEAPQVRGALRGPASGREGQFLGMDEPGERHVADVAPDVLVRGQRGAALDLAVGLDAEARHASLAALPHHAQLLVLLT